ncbi:MAG TPA: rod-binding protein [Candidatus Binatus sp.]|nr:rod-binding protein [Candidatus Binatus sp.]
MMRSDTALLDACRQFEAVLLRPLFDSLSVGRLAPAQTMDPDEGETFDGACAGNVMQSYFSEMLALALARSGGFGIATLLASRLAEQP